MLHTLPVFVTYKKKSLPTSGHDVQWKTKMSIIPKNTWLAIEWPIFHRQIDFVLTKNNNEKPCPVEFEFCQLKLWNHHLIQNYFTGRPSYCMSSAQKLVEWHLWRECEMEIRRGSSKISSNKLIFCRLGGIWLISEFIQYDVRTVYLSIRCWLEGLCRQKGRVFKKILHVTFHQCVFGWCKWNQVSNTVFNSNQVLLLRIYFLKIFPNDPFDISVFSVSILSCHGYTWI